MSVACHRLVGSSCGPARGRSGHAPLVCCQRRSDHPRTEGAKTRAVHPDVPDDPVEVIPGHPRGVASCRGRAACRVESNRDLWRVTARCVRALGQGKCRRPVVIGIRRFGPLTDRYRRQSAGRLSGRRFSRRIGPPVTAAPPSVPARASRTRRSPGRGRSRALGSAVGRVRRSGSPSSRSCGPCACRWSG